MGLPSGVCRVLREGKEKTATLLEEPMDHPTSRALLLASSRIFTLKNAVENRLKFDCPASPYDPIDTDPTRGERTTYELMGRGLGRVVAGDWDSDANTTPLSENPTYNGLKQRFVEEREWEDTVYFQRAKEKIDRNGSTEGYSDCNEFLRVRCEYVDRLFENIRTEGYRPNFEGGHDTPQTDFRSDERQYQHSLEPLVCIGRDGELFWMEGLHRLTIARIIDFNSIPVQVVARHRQWQELRDNICTGGLSTGHAEAVREHPDLQDVLD